MKKMLFGLLLCGMVLVFALVSASPAMTANEEGRVRVWVQFAPGTKGAVENALVGANAEFHYVFDDLDAFVVSVPEAALEGLRHNPNVVLIEEDAKRYPMEQETPYGVDMVQARDVWDANRDGTVDAGAPTGAGRTVCVIDSGMYTAHEDLKTINVLGGYPSNWNQDSCGHGSHVTGTIAAANNAAGVVGVTPGSVDLFVVKVFGDNCAWTYSSTLTDAANRCANAGADVISMSLGGGFSALENQAFSNLYNAGILSIAAAGNAGTTATSYPAGYASVVSVAAIDSNKVVADFSQKNADVELAAPGVSVLSTVPYIETNNLVVGGATYSANAVEYAERGTASGALVDGGLCGSAGLWSGKVVLCQRGTYDFYTKVMSVQNGGGVAAVLYNNVPGNFLGTLGDGNSSVIPAISLSQEDGQALVASSLGQTGTVTSAIQWNVNGYAYYDGTSMATPHVSAAAALVWSANPGWTNTQVRDALNATAFDLGAAGRDSSYGYGLVQAKAALDYLTGGTTEPQALSVTVQADKAAYANRQTVYLTTTVQDEVGAAVASAAVSVKITAPNAKVIAKTCTTAAAGTCVVSWKVDTRKYGTGTYAVTSTATKTGYTAGSGTTTFLVQ